MLDYSQMQADRLERSYDVQANYHVEFVGLQAWVVQHPDEPERCYLVDMSERKCSCPDWHCTVQGLGVDCKHILAIEPDWLKLTGKKRSAFTRNTEADVEIRQDMAEFSDRMAELSHQDPYERI
jgi:hypothetical protein